MTDLTEFGVSDPQEPAGDDDDEPDEPASQWPACIDCGYVGREVKSRLGQSVPLCTACFAEREGLL
ncbi:hypothetical protein [Halopiger goleimassiliensis]|uniref:hypothetical protein n=1 Tax=Halopiger goleimassiliensis TaxID=1293048 RepID=UPI0006781308|nr:hypothetical protein [Halopiger goleimassiliensis]